MTHIKINHTYPFSHLGKFKTKQGHRDNTKRHTHKQTRNRKTEIYPTQNDSKLQVIHEHHPNSSKHVKYSVQLKDKLKAT